MSATIQPQPGILQIELYKSGKSAVEGMEHVVKLSSNENPLGASDAAKVAYAREMHSLNRYPSSDHIELRTAIAQIHDLDADRIICGAGSDEVITFLCQAYAGPGDEVVYTEHGFLMYPISTLAVGATPVKVAEKERVADVDAILAACTPKTRLVFIANPNNPTGTMISGRDMARLAAGIPEKALLVIDGAYAEYVEGYDGGTALVDKLDNVVMTRTFSKIYGLGGLRVGWGYGPRHVIDVLNRIRGPFNLSSAGLASAEAAVRDVGFVDKCRKENARMRKWLTLALLELGIDCDTSFANFILARFADEVQAEACNQALANEGLIVRQVAAYGLPNCLRITVGDEASCRRVAHTISNFFNAVLSEPAIEGPQ
ncbi:histidinol-phosphate transaminase [Falsihalocynthiibacter sp. BN13B15]|uniref:histidinol-phosphate transaminase n=1 Tax=Falsihalocynthiibacter sp. BN13B15 TaxID=3240871 RepID=UPI00350F72C8